MDRATAALNPEAADRYNAERLGNRLLAPDIIEMTEMDTNRARTAFLGVAEEIRDEAQVELAKRADQSEKIWRNV